jgi:hypothetical protein
MEARKFISQSHARHTQFHVRATFGSETGPCCIGATFMAPTWDCKAKAKKKTVGRREYTKADVKELRAHSKAKTPVVKIAKLTKRSVGSLRQKALKLGIRLGHRR